LDRVERYVLAGKERVEVLGRLPFPVEFPVTGDIAPEAVTS